MFTIGPKITAAIGATKDRKYINQYAKGKINEPSDFYDILVKKSGPPAKTFKEKFQSWLKAYDANMERINIVRAINERFKIR